MRGKKTIKNTIFALLEEIVAIICGFILPHLILSAYGSKYNGLTTSITQFLSCAILLRSGVGGATRAALYKAIADNDKNEINSIVKATDIFMKKIGIILAVAIFIFSLIYPIFVIDEFSYLFSFSLFLIIGLSTFAESFFGITYLIILQADQKLWVSSLLRMICNILNIILAVILIITGSGIHVVKLVSSIVFILYPIALQIYVRKKYKINLGKDIKPNNKAIEQRWDAFWHQVASFVTNNTDVIVLTIFTNVLEVSIYAVYNMIISALKRTISSFSNGLEAAFGNMIARNEKDILKTNVSIMETILYSISTIVFTVAIIMILQFVNIYTKNVNDVNYAQPLFAYILLIAQFFNSTRLSYQLVVQAAGHYKQTKKRAMLEPILNVILSVILVIRFGIVGVAIGTLVSTIIRTVQYSNYMSKNIVKRSRLIMIIRTFISIVESLLIIIISNFINLSPATSYIRWIFNASIITLISTCVVFVGDWLFYKNDCLALINKFNYIFKKKKIVVE